MSPLLPAELHTCAGMRRFCAAQAMRCSQMCGSLIMQCSIKWGGLRKVDLPPLCPRNLGGNAPPIYQGTQRNQNFLGTQGETSVLDQVKSASSCQ